MSQAPNTVDEKQMRELHIRSTVFQKESQKENTESKDK